MHVITGATGNIGNVLANDLISRGKKVRVISRKADKLKPFIERGAETAIGDLYDSEFVSHAFRGASEAFCMIPPNFLSNDFKKDQRIVADNLFEAVKSNHIKYVVLLSSIGAHLREGAGVVDGLGYMEEKFQELKDVNIVNLRPGYFMENLFGQISNIVNFKIIATPINADAKIPMVATKDIAQAAFMLLNYLQFQGNSVKYVLGPYDVSYSEATRILSVALNEPDLKYMQLPYEEIEKKMVESGFVSANVAGLYSGLSKAINNGSALCDYQRTAQNSTTTSIEMFSHDFAHVFSGVVKQK
jgi:uncharacterized protein YbjT (DUF2867 family)